MQEIQKEVNIKDLLPKVKSIQQLLKSAKTEWELLSRMYVTCDFDEIPAVTEGLETVAIQYKTPICSLSIISSIMLF